jgi:hypothetical protein
MWDIVIAPGAVREVVQAGTRLLADVANEYLERTGRHAQLHSLITRSIDELKARRNHVAALKALVNSVEYWRGTYKKVRGRGGLAWGEWESVAGAFTAGRCFQALLAVRYL